MLDINDFKDNLVEFECLRIRDARTIWLNDEATADLENVLDQGLSEASFARHFAYMSKANRCFGKGELDENDSRVYWAERYGGRGVGDNGGGGRAGNFGKFQIKGNGPNPLAGGQSVWHSYGSLNLVDAAYEAIYSTVLGRILPMGCAKIYGLVRTSDTGAFQLFGWGTEVTELTPAPGALLVRERVLRPAHLMHADHFTPPKTTSLKREPMRIRSVYRQLKTKFDSDNHFIQFAGRFILASAKQFAFARAARIAHGGMTPSNISLDGRWLDLTEARFLSGGKNFRGQTPFFDEPHVVVESVRQLLYVYGKCNGAQFHIEPLLRYFDRVFANCFAYYSLSVLGLPETHLENIAESDDGKAVAAAYDAVVRKSKAPLADLPAQHDPDDPVIAFMGLSYLGLANSENVSQRFSELLRTTPDKAHDVLVAFKDVLRSAALQRLESPSADRVRNCYIACAIKALRWAYLSAYFYRGRIALQLHTMAHEKRLDELGHYIQDCVDQSKWIFDTASTGQIVIAQTAKIRIVYDETLHRYTLAGDCDCSFERYEDCLSFVTANYPELQLSGTFDLDLYLQALGEVLTGLENMSCTQV